MRRPHYIKQNNSSEYPRHCIWLDTETTPERIDIDTIKHNLEFGWACYRRRSRGHKWSKPIWFRFTTLQEFWLWVTETINKKECFTLFAHNGSFDIPVLDGFNWLQDDGWALVNAVIESPPIILKWRKDGKSIKFIDTMNIWTMSLRAIGQSIGLDKLDMPDGWTDKELGDEYCKRDVEIIMTACIQWFEFILEHDLGGFAPTLASQAMRAYRHRFMKHEILIDDNELALKIARLSYHGGRTECFYIGEVEGPLYQLDFNSMYPDVMYNQMMPTKLVGVYRRVSHDELADLLMNACVVAEVVIDIDVPAMPRYINGKLIFPTGRYETVLTTPELKFCLENGYIESIEHVCIYEQAMIFTEYVDYMYNLRLKAKADNNDTLSFMAKILLNSLYGKFGQRGMVYETIEQVNDNEIKSWVEIDGDTDEIIRLRKFAGMVQQRTEEPEARDSHPAIAAHVTAHARMKLWDAYTLAEIKNCYYSDTDCIVVNQTGYDKLQSMIDEHELGMLKVEKVISHAMINGPKDYVFDDAFALKGVKFNALWLDRSTVEQEQWAGLKGLMRKGDLTAPTTKTIIKHLKRQYTKGNVLPSGVVVPFEYQE